MTTCDVAIIGAGPYGLSAAAHLRAANGLDIRVFGEPMSFWERHMPKGMLLRSPLAGSHLSDPSRSLTLQAYQSTSGNRITAPLPLDRFTDYGRWFQSQVVPSTDSRKVERVEKNGAGFRITLEDGETWKARRVIFAAGIEPFAWRPAEFQRIPSALASGGGSRPLLLGLSFKHGVTRLVWLDPLTLRPSGSRSAASRTSTGWHPGFDAQSVEPIP